MHFLPGTCRVLAPLQAVRLITPTPFLHLGRGSLGAGSHREGERLGKALFTFLLQHPKSGLSQVGTASPLTLRDMLRASYHPSKLHAASARREKQAERTKDKIPGTLSCMVGHWTRLQSQPPQSQLCGLECRTSLRFSFLTGKTGRNWNRPYEFVVRFQ